MDAKVSMEEIDMVRAGVFIGVNKTGNLPKLNDASAGARRMYDWAISQGMSEDCAKLITDDDGKKVTPDMIYDCIKEIIDGPGVEQLLVYFAGHGVNISRSEHWLLSEAPVKASAAVNVYGSVELARYCGIQHVIIISDACRVAPEGIQAQNVRGVDIFPNDGAGDKAKPVDQFFACYLGKTAAEIKDPTMAAANYSALYTNALLCALKGECPEVLEPADVPGDNAYYVKPLKLENFLETEVPRRVKQMKLEFKVNQNPDAIITSHAGWLARIIKAGEFAVPPQPVRGDALGPFALTGNLSSQGNLRGVGHTLLQSVVGDNRSALDLQLQEVSTRGVAGAQHLVGTAERIQAPFGPDSFETQCGIKIRGTRIVDFFVPRADAVLRGGEGNILSIKLQENLAQSVLLRFEGGVGTVIPAIPGFIAALTYDDGELVDVAYEPSIGDWRWDMYQGRAADLRALRAVAAAASQHGRFELDEADAIKVAQRMQYAKSIDPTLAVYAAYAYHDMQVIERIREMTSYLSGDIGVTFFDLALLSRMLIDRPIQPGDGILPFFPLLSQGWGLLKAHRVRLHPQLAGIEDNMRDSLWSLFDATGLEKLKHIMQSKEVR